MSLPRTHKRKRSRLKRMGLLLKLLGLVDLAAALLLFLANLDFPARAVLTVALLLAIKGLVFMKDPVSTFDVILAVYLGLTIMFNVTLLSILFGIYLVFKGFYSFV